MHPNQKKYFIPASLIKSVGNPAPPTKASLFSGIINKNFGFFNANIFTLSLIHCQLSLSSVPQPVPLFGNINIFPEV